MLKEECKGCPSSIICLSRQRIPWTRYTCHDCKKEVYVLRPSNERGGWIENYKETDKMGSGIRCTPPTDLNFATSEVSCDLCLETQAMAAITTHKG